MSVLNYLKNAPKFFELFKEGKELTNAATWKNRTIATNACIAFFGTIVVLAKSFGYDLKLDQDTVANFGAGIVAIVGVINAVMHTITSARVGLSTNGGDSSTEGQPSDADKSAEG
jgi:hypothetical protein